MKRFSNYLPLLAALLICAPGCKKKAPEKKKSPPVTAAKEVSKPAPTPQPDVSAPEGSTDVSGAKDVSAPPEISASMARKMSEYTFFPPLEPPAGPETPPIAADEGIAPSDLTDWKEVNYIRSDPEVQKEFVTPLDAALDPDSLNNSGQLLFELARERDIDTLLMKFPPPEADYIELLKYQGVEDTSMAFGELKAVFKERLAVLGPTYQSYKGPIGRKDKLFSTSMRVTRWRFEFVDSEGATKQGCYTFLLADNAWRILDMSCPEEPQK